jgi:cation transport ATPase
MKHSSVKGITSTKNKTRAFLLVLILIAGCNPTPSEEKSKSLNLEEKLDQQRQEASKSDSKLEEKEQKVERTKPIMVKKQVPSQSETSQTTSNVNRQDSERTKIASIILSVTCGAKVGLIPRSQMGVNIKKQLQMQGYDPSSIYANWDFYWKRVQEMDRRTNSNCVG